MNEFQHPGSRRLVNSGKFAGSRPGSFPLPPEPSVFRVALPGYSADMHQDVRWIFDSPARGSWNMAVDRALLESANHRQQITVRIYQWEPATLSLGYFQAARQRDGHVASRDCPLVRRASGGGAIVHDRELTYSIVIPATDPWARRNSELVGLVHRSLVGCLEHFGFHDLMIVERSTAATGSDPFLCFQRRAAGDVVYRGAKIIGSAQRRQKEAILQHGSLLLARSDHAPELPGLSELGGGRVPAVEELARNWARLMERACGWRHCRGETGANEQQRAREIEQQVFANRQWTDKR